MQLTKLKKQSIKGFTLIELLVVIAIIGLLSTIVAAPIQSARKKAKDTKKLAEVRTLQTSLANYANDNGFYPAGSSTAANTNALNVLSPQYIPSIPNGFTSPSTRDKYMYTSATGQAPGAAASTTFGYHLGTTLEVFNSVLDSDDDCWGIVSTTSPNVTGNKNGGGCSNFVMGSSTNILSANYFGATSSVVSGFAGFGSTAANIGATGLALTVSPNLTFTSYVFLSHPAWRSSTADFQGLGTFEGSSSTCGTVDNCIYDVSDSY